MPKGMFAKLQASRALVFLLPWGVLASLYLITAPRTVTFEDAGLFLTTSFDWGLPHPPGYPLYTMLVHIFMKVLPFSPAFVGSLFSILCGLATFKVIYKIFRQYDFEPHFAVVGMLFVGLGQTFWNQMIVPEVYALHCLLFTLLWYFALRVSKVPNIKNSLAMFLVLGLGLANHWPLIILSGPIVLFTVWPVRNILFRFWPHLILGLLLSFLCYYLMYWRSNSGAEYLFTGPIHNLKELWGYISRDYYKLADAQAPFRLGESIKFVLSYAFNQLVLELTPFSIPFFALGLKQVRLNSRGLFYTLIYGLASTSIILAFTLRFEFNELNYNVYRVFHLIPHICYALLMIFGLRQILLKRRRVGYGLVSLVLIGSLILGLKVNNFSKDNLADGYSKLILDSLPRNAVLFAATDADVGPLAYVNGVENYRSDISLMTQTGVFFPKKIFDPFEFGRNARTRATREFLVQNVPVFSTKKFDILDKEKGLPLSFKYNGIYYLIDSSFSSNPPKTPAMIEAADRLAKNQLEQKWLFNWPYHRNVVMSRLCNLLVLNDRDDHPAFSDNRSCRLVRAKHLRAQKKYQDSSLILRDLIENDSWFMVSSEAIDLYNVDLMNQLDWVNVGVTGGNEKLEHVRKAVDFAVVSLDLYDGCDHPVAEIIKSIQPDPGYTENTLRRLRDFQKCRKTAVLKKVKRSTLSK